MASDIIKTFGIMLKLEGVNDIKKTLNELDARVSNITRQTVDKIKVEKENLRLMKEQAKLANEQVRSEERSKKFSAEFSTKSLISAEKVKQATIKTTESAIKKDQAGWRFKIARENDKIKREKRLEQDKLKRTKAEAQVEKIRARTLRASTSTSRGGGRDSIRSAIWSAGGGLMGLQALGKLAIEGIGKVVGYTLNLGESGQYVENITKGLSGDERKKMIQLLSNLEKTGQSNLLPMGTMTNFVSNLRDALSAAQTSGDKSLINAWGTVGAKFRWDKQGNPNMLEVMRGILENANTPISESMLSGLTGVKERRALQSYKPYGGNVYEEYRNAITIASSLNSSIETLKNALATSFAQSTVDIFKQLAEAAQWFSTRDGKELMKSFSFAAKTLAEAIGLAVSVYSKILGITSSVSNKVSGAAANAYYQSQQRGLNAKTAVDVPLEILAKRAGVSTSGKEFETFKSKLFLDYKKEHPFFTDPYRFSDFLQDRVNSESSSNTTTNNQSFNFNINVSGGTMTPSQARELGYNLGIAFNEVMA